MDLEKTIRASSWWAAAERTADRHYLAESGATVADHLRSVHGMVELLLDSDVVADPYVSELRLRLNRSGSPDTVAADLRLVALLHDIGKPRENKNEMAIHPLSGREAPRRHPMLGAVAALELIPDAHGRKDLIAALVSKHGTGWSWYRQWRSSGQIPSKKAWRRLDRCLPAGGEGFGLIHLALFKLADIDGHGDLSDVSWFVEQANVSLLDDLGRQLPVPDLEVLERLRGRLRE